MKRYFIILGIYTLFFCVGLYGQGYKKSTLYILKNAILGKENPSDWTSLLIIDITLKVFSFLLLFVFLLPMIQDIGNLRNQEFSKIQGEVVQRDEFLGTWYIYQRILIEGKEIDLYLNEPVKVGEQYTIYYLPKSRYGVEAIQQIQ